MAFIAGSPLAVQLMSNRLSLNNKHSIYRSAAYSRFVTHIKDWLDQNLTAPYLLHAEATNGAEIIIGFPSTADMILFKLAFEGWTESLCI